MGERYYVQLMKGLKDFKLMSKPLTMIIGKAIAGAMIYAFSKFLNSPDMKYPIELPRKAQRNIMR